MILAQTVANLLVQEIAQDLALADVKRVVKDFVKAAPDRAKANVKEAAPAVVERLALVDAQSIATKNVQIHVLRAVKVALDRAKVVALIIVLGLAVVGARVL